MDGRDALLAIAMNGTALPVAHGFPVRLVIPGLYGYVSACKWLTDIEVTTYAANVSYWAQRGWSAQAPIKTESRIDVPAWAAPIKAGKQTAIAGVAWAQHKGIEAVEVRIAKGPWQEAKLAAVPDLDTWRQWVYYWDANVPPGNYLIESRATDKTGYTQTALQEPPEPNGASGYPSNLVTSADAGPDLSAVHGPPVGVRRSAQWDAARSEQLVADVPVHVRAEPAAELVEELLPPRRAAER